MHLLFWLAHILLFAILRGGVTVSSILASMMVIPFQMIYVYAVLYWLFPKYLIVKEYLKFSLLTALLLMAVTFALQVFSWLHEVDGTPFRINISMIVSTIVILGYMTSLAVGIKLLKYWNQREKYISELSTAKLKAELRFLKAQIHPHFLFNTLNNLYTLTLNRSPKAPKVVEKISELLRYISYEVSDENVPLRNEINCIHNYIALEKIRYGDQLELSLDIDVDDEGQSIAPLILLPFVENSFKHGVSNVIDKNWITLYLSLEKGILIFKIENPIGQHAKDPVRYREGIGLKNVKRRLELIYPDKHDLRIVKEDTHLVILTIDLT